ncbi:hypothetical protein HLASA_1096 [Halanaeroarchaeum sulfurireducens]|uniref:RNA ligase domain-containing protein n=2 Tax=Halanaeroarchaeum sulfurireducens TaxID=1604004 RepID=A0A0N7FTM7_9EURY|nr:hypothetical protein HLASA_1096 [Halanaeroarchaeum sulfurireducens]
MPTHSTFGTQVDSMHPYPTIRSIEETATSLNEGHLWLQEYVTGPILGWTMDESGLITFGMDGETVDTAPPSLRRAVDHVRTHIDRDGLRSGVDDVSQFVFYGFATRNEGIDYDWEAIQPFLGVDIWAAPDEDFVPPDVTERVYDAIGLAPIPAFEKELPATHFDPATYEPPQSHWRDGPAVGVVVRKKGGMRYRLGSKPTDVSQADTVDPETVIDSEVSRLLDGELDRLNATAETVDVNTLADRIFDRIARTSYVALRDELNTAPDGVREMVRTAVRGEIRTTRRGSDDTA